LLGIADAIRTADVHVSDKCSESIANLLSSCEDLGRSGEVSHACIVTAPNAGQRGLGGMHERPAQNAL